MQDVTSLKTGLNRLHSTFAPFSDIADDEYIKIGATEVRVLLSTIRTLRHLARLAEREIGALRMMEEERRRKAVVATELDNALDEKTVPRRFGGVDETASAYASDLIRSMRSKLRDAGHGGLVLRSEDAIAWERELNTVLALVDELKAESTMLANGLEARMRADERGGRPRFVLITSNDDGNGGGPAA